jgi:hypothetical protein
MVVKGTEILFGVLISECSDCIHHYISYSILNRYLYHTNLPRGWLVKPHRGPKIGLNSAEVMQNEPQLG